MATSGTVSTVVYRNRQILDRAFARAGYAPQRISGEALQIGLEVLYGNLGELVAAGFPLWTRQYALLACQIGSPTVTTPQGTLDVFDTFWRILRPYRGPCTVNAVGDSTLFGGQPNADVVIAAPNPSVAVNFTTPTELDTIGVLLGTQAAIPTASLEVQTSLDGATWATVQTLPSTTFQPLVWSYFDLNPSITSQYVRLVYVNPSDSWTLNQVNFGLANGQDIMMGTLNQDSYYQLPNKFFQDSQPNSYFVDRQLNTPVIDIWPTPNATAYYGGTVTALMRRYIQDPGTLRDSLEVPQRWLEAIQWRLASNICTDIPYEVVTGEQLELTALKMQDRQQRMQTCEARATRAEALAWGEERTTGPIMMSPNFSCYTK